MNGVALPHAATFQTLAAISSILLIFPFTNVNHWTAPMQ
jgi:hypothetical protein